MKSVISGAPSKDDVDFDKEVVTIDEAFENETIEDQPQSNAPEEDFDSEMSNHSFDPDIPNNIEYPVDVFLCLFTTKLLEKIVFETHLYGNRFIPTSLDEIKAFIGVDIMMGHTKKPSYTDYWSSKIEMRDPFISSPKKKEEGYDKLYQLRPLLDILAESYKKCFKPSENQSIDETIVKFKHRIGFRQYMPLKPIKRWYKIWARAGYLCQFQVYTGKADSTEKSLGEDSCVLKLDLEKDNIYACCTAGKGRKRELKDLLADKEMKRGSSDGRASSTLLYVKWMDNKAVRFLSNFHCLKDCQTITKKKDGTIESINCLQVVKNYNKHMGLAVVSGLTGSTNDTANKRGRKFSIEFSRFKQRVKSRGKESNIDRLKGRVDYKQEHRKNDVVGQRT
ncbi:hypothetical protein ILUMI_10998 [Ignelater luminosus]|uniref:PiggyBac transposable element-derived protein domain-containing protein n=1 Tax=Ignelater luminosus TaxID=2038154 RepID=A0A8K0G850_IGNLU|nr:hypothetical protein ILUMI_10998 [Ignelater luminosus]